VFENNSFLSISRGGRAKEKACGKEKSQLIVKLEKERRLSSITTLQRFRPAITVGPATLLQGDWAIGPYLNGIDGPHCEYFCEGCTCDGGRDG